MKTLLIFFCSLGLMLSACDKNEAQITAKEEVKKTAPVAEDKKKEAPKVADTPKSKMSDVHTAIKENKKIVAVKHYRKHFGLPLHVALMAVEVEQTKLGKPSKDKVRSLLWSGKREDAKAHLQLAVKSLDAKRAEKELGKIELIGASTKENMEKHLKEGKLNEAMLIYRHLNPKVEVPEIYKILSAKVAKKK